MKTKIEKKIDIAIIILSIIYLLIDIPHFFIYRLEQIKHLGTLYEPHSISFVKWLFVILFLWAATIKNRKNAIRISTIAFLSYFVFAYIFLLHHSVTGSIVLLTGILEIIALLTLVKLISILFQYFRK